MERSIVKTAVLGFVAGAIGVLAFHQGFVAILVAVGHFPVTAYSLQPTLPFHVPEVLSLAFWGGIWGIALIFLMERVRGGNRLWVAFVVGGILPPLAAALIVTPLKGGNVADWLEWRHIVFGFLINAVWGLGTALTYRFEQRMAG